MSNLREEMLARISANRARKGTFIAMIHDQLMAEYGWIPLEEFKQLPADTVFSLIDAAVERHKNETKKKPRGRGLEDGNI